MTEEDKELIAGYMGWHIVTVGPKSYVADQLPRPVERRIVMDNEKITRSAAIGWIALVGLSIMAAQNGVTLCKKCHYKRHTNQK